MKAIFALLACACLSLVSRAATDYPPAPETKTVEGVPKGTVAKRHHISSAIFPGAERDYWVYVPAQYDPAKPACLMVFQDGGGYANEKGAWKIPVVFDNLIHAGHMPVTIGVFVDPGVVPAPGDKALPRFNRSFEYDSTGDRYARFLLEELLPEVKKEWNLSEDPNDRAIGGSSSGAVCAFTVAWERPDSFRRVFSTIGTYIGLRGAERYPTMIRLVEPKPLRVFLQDGSGDLDIYAGDWFSANLAMLSALKFAGYEVEHAWGDGGHDSKHGAHILADALRWLWKDHGTPVQTHRENGRQPLARWLPADSAWKLVRKDENGPVNPVAAADGRVAYLAQQGSVIRWIEDSGEVGRTTTLASRAAGLSVNEDGALSVFSESRALTITPDGGVNGKEAAGPGCVVRGHGYLGVAGASAACASPDQSQLFVAEGEDFVTAYGISGDGSLINRQDYFRLKGKRALGLTVDEQGWLYAATELGVEVLDQAGRVNGILPLPEGKAATGVCFGGPDFRTLIVTSGDAIYARPLNQRGVRGCDESVLPEKPHL